MFSLQENLLTPSVYSPKKLKIGLGVKIQESLKAIWWRRSALSGINSVLRKKKPMKLRQWIILGNSPSNQVKISTKGWKHQRESPTQVAYKKMKEIPSEIMVALEKILLTFKIIRTKIPSLEEMKETSLNRGKIIRSLLRISKIRITHPTEMRLLGLTCLRTGLWIITSLPQIQYLSGRMLILWITWADIRKWLLGLLIRSNQGLIILTGTLCSPQCPSSRTEVLV